MEGVDSAYTTASELLNRLEVAIGKRDNVSAAGEIASLERVRDSLGSVIGALQELRIAVAHSESENEALLLRLEVSRQALLESTRQAAVFCLNNVAVLPEILLFAGLENQGEQDVQSRFAPASNNEVSTLHSGDADGDSAADRIIRGGRGNNFITSFLPSRSPKKMRSESSQYSHPNQGSPISVLDVLDEYSYHPSPSPTQVRRSLGQELNISASEDGEPRRLPAVVGGAHDGSPGKNDVAMGTPFSQLSSSGQTSQRKGGAAENSSPSIGAPQRSKRTGKEVSRKNNDVESNQGKRPLMRLIETGLSIATIVALTVVGRNMPDHLERKDYRSGWSIKKATGGGLTSTKTKVLAPGLPHTVARERVAPITIGGPNVLAGRG